MKTFNNNSKVPSVDGETYKVKELFVNCGENTIHSPKTKKYTVVFSQNGRFVSALDHEKRLCLGVWQNRGCGRWQLILSINKGDNDLFILTPTKITSDNVVKEFDAVNIEAGSTSSNPKQKLGVGCMTYKRIRCD
jgi:hypothetical protein